jgi:hypothetical protein
LSIVVRATIANVCVGFPEPTTTDECRKASPVAVWHSSSFHAPGTELARAAKAGEVEERRLARDEVADERRVSKPR